MYKNFRKGQEKSDERKLLEAKINDKYKFANSKNKITYTDFLNDSEINICEKYLKDNSIKNYLYYGGNGEKSERKILIFYPVRLSEEMVSKNFDKILSVIHIELPKGLDYEHRIYLSGIMKLGIKREKVGDILVRENGADIIVLNEISEFLRDNLKELTRFKKSTIEIININDIKIQEKQFQEISIIVSSMRIDNFVSELAKCSRTKTIEIINEQRVFLNYDLELKYSKKVNIGDIITIRGKGKFVVKEIDHKTKSNKFILNIKKYI